MLDNDFFSKGRYSSARADEGHLTTVWQTPNTTRLADGTTLVTLLLQAKDEKSTAHVTVTDAVIPTRVFDALLSELQVNVVERLHANEESQMEILEVYPNPAVSSTVVLINSPDQQEGVIEISDLSGKAVFMHTQILEAGKNVLTVDTEKWTKGIYLLELRTMKTFQIVKIVKH